MISASGLSPRCQMPTTAPSSQIGSQATTSASLASTTKETSRRFGPLSPEVIRQLERATPEQLETWTDRVLDARTLDEVFIEL